MDISGLCAQLREEAQAIEELPKARGSHVSRGYFEALEALRCALKPLSQAICSDAESCGFRSVQLLQANPTSRSQHLFFAVAHPETGALEKLLPQVISTHKSSTRDPSLSMLKACQDQVGFGGRKGQLRQVPVLSASTDPCTSRVNELWVAVISREQASELRQDSNGPQPQPRQLSLGNATVTLDDSIAGDVQRAGIDPQILGSFLAAYNSSSDVYPFQLCLAETQITAADIELAQQTERRLTELEVSDSEIGRVVRRLEALSYVISLQGRCDDDWRCEEYGYRVQRELQAIVDSVARRWFTSPLTESSTHNVLQQVDVQAAQAVKVNGQALPAWMTPRLLAVMQAGSQATLVGRSIRIASIEEADNGQVMNIVTEIV